MGIDTLLEWAIKIAIGIALGAIVLGILMLVFGFADLFVDGIAAMDDVLEALNFYGLPFVSADYAPYNVLSWLSGVAAWGVGLFIVKVAFNRMRWIISLLVGGGDG